MKRNKNLLLSLGVAAVLAACSTTPERIDELEAARTAVNQVESSPRAGVAAEQVSNARKALNTADRLAESGGDLEDIKFEASVANKNAQIAQEKISAAQARDEVEKGTAERQRILAEARENEARASQQAAREAQRRADMLEEELRSLRAKPTERGMVLTLGDVLFDTGQSTLKPGAFATIDRVATVLKESPDRKVMIEGHTDSVGAEDFNLGLSERRARAVQAALMERGVAANQITAVGRGETVPVASNDNAGGRQQNRRVELIFEQTSEPRVASDD